MKTIHFLLAWVLSVTVYTETNAQQWTRIDKLPHSDFSALEVIDGTLYAAHRSTLYYSNDNGVNWSQVTMSALTLDPMCMIQFGGRLYVGTYNRGIYSAPMNNLQGAWTQNLNNVPITSFVEKDNILYASTEGSGVLRSNGDGQFHWFSNGLPNYSNNVSKVISAPNGLIATAGGNGTFYRWNTATHNWDEDYYFAGYSPGMQVDDALRVGNTIYISRFNMVLRSDDSGANWTHDQVGLQNGHNRYLYAGEQTLYALTTVFTGDDNLTFLRKRPLNAPSQSSWATDPEVLPFYTYAMREFGNTLFAGSNLGLYYKGNHLGTGHPEREQNTLVVYPNPSKRRYLLDQGQRPRYRNFHL
ncbi:hypothetical protein [Flavobacterium sp.]|uniref:hypothetical protein n=1 Tax=Flavobacterium sp. TaxID=239 RepID=UPI0039E285DF